MQCTIISLVAFLHSLSGAPCRLDDRLCELFPCTLAAPLLAADMPAVTDGPGPRSGTAQEGIALLKRGSMVMKYGRQGKPHPTTFTLSQDENELFWESKKGLASALSSRKPRSVSLADALQLDVGQESAVFRRNVTNAAASDKAHLSLSLLLLPAVEEEVSGSGQRETLDISFDDEEIFVRGDPHAPSARQPPASLDLNPL